MTKRGDQFQGTTRIDLIRWLASEKRLGNRDELVLGVVNSPHRNRIVYMLEQPGIGNPLGRLFQAQPVEEHTHDEAVLAILNMAAMPAEYFIDRTDWKVTNREQDQARKAARRLRGQLDMRRMDRLDWRVLQAKADHALDFSHTGRSFDVLELTEALDEYLRLFEWVCDLPNPPQGSLESRKKSSANDRALVKCRLLKREAPKHLSPLPYPAIAELASIAEDANVGPDQARHA